MAFAGSTGCGSEIARITARQYRGLGVESHSQVIDNVLVTRLYEVVSVKVIPEHIFRRLGLARETQRGGGLGSRVYNFLNLADENEREKN